MILFPDRVFFGFSEYLNRIRLDFVASDLFFVLFYGSGYADRTFNTEPFYPVEKICANHFFQDDALDKTSPVTEYDEDNPFTVAAVLYPALQDDMFALMFL